MPDIPSNLVTGISGLMVAADVPTRFIEAAMAGKIEPVRVVILHRGSSEKMYEWPCRPISPEEAVMLINRYLMEGKIEFGFRKREQTYGGPIA